jgi:pyruvate-formate lyase
MNQRLESMRRRVRDGEHRHFRQSAGIEIVTECDAEGLSWSQRSARLTLRQCEAERPVILADERIVFTRTLPTIPELYSEVDFEALTAGHTLHERGTINNICADWGMVLGQGLLGRRAVACASLERLAGDSIAVDALRASIVTIDAVLALAEAYACEADRLGRSELAERLRHVPANQPRTFEEALQSLRLLQAAVWLSGHHHVGLGRLDQYMWPYLEGDLAAGRLDFASAEELLAEFFICLNSDSDLYPGFQQGDNGQTVTLGGVRADGESGVNELTSMALRVSRDVAMIDPKINLRVDARTDLALLGLATELTAKGLGFPQYSNDDVVIPALVAHGYDLSDARDYTVAACWEFIIPGRGMEIVNTGAVSFPYAADTGIRGALGAGEGFEGVMQRTSVEIERQVRFLVEAYSTLLLAPAAYYSVLMDGCLEEGRDLSTGAKYINLGIHGAAASSGADALAAVRQFVFEERSVEPATLLAALDADFEGSEALRRRLADEGPKVGNDEPEVDDLLVWLYERFADACEGVGRTAQGRLVRPGTGSAMFYLWLARGREGIREPVVGATADGRLKGTPFGANLAPSQGVRVRGPFSLLRSFSKIDYRRICNGGPITLELADSIFRDRESIEKTALLVRTFALLGCQQLQLNALNADTLLDAKAHPERHRDLIVRVWGWSGYFCELAPEYQDHVIARHLFGAIR